MANMMQFPLNRSEYGIYMNETAFPGTAINTIGFMLRFSTIGADALCKAADQVIDNLPVFGARFAVKNGKPMIEWSEERPSHCRRSRPPMTDWEATDTWERLTAEPLDNKCMTLLHFRFRAAALP